MSDSLGPVYTSTPSGATSRMVAVLIERPPDKYSNPLQEILEDFYLRDPFACANTEKRQVLCQMLSIDPYRLKVWFQNRRRKDKVSCESQKPKEEL
ncbi:unnamed protein product [Heligmosomoides polygyrus]|uniref:Homeobox domain-containing protein n=1 Tax=Heligmosomoides polygyrus TaxID=6339 RepID=A0A3P8GG82_HELPZ|nr:unnamed protein product [Heligmosomoides polygyrus]